ncbi:MAG: peptidoglycan-binding protein [Clostridia bacterium]|nr:peptidoglycan-binding protein [Clostridia bacterium]
MKRIRQILAIALAILMLLSLLPTSALAATGECRATGGAHEWGKWTVQKKATCLEKGRELHTCAACGVTDAREIPKAGHNYGSWKTTKEPACDKEGEETRKCRVCGHVDKRKIDKLPHNWGEWEIVTEATDHSSGTRKHTCRVCGATETAAYDAEGTLRRGARGDAVKRLQEGLICYGAMDGRADGIYGKGTERAVRKVQEAEGLTADGVAWLQTQALVQHRFGEWKTISTLTRTTDGVRERVCERCGLVERDVVEAKPIIKRGDRGKQVEVIQSIIWDMGYNPGKIDGRFGPRLDAAIVEWARDHDWYYEPGLLKPIDIDRIVEGWTKVEVDRTGISGPDTPVNLQISVTPDFNMILVAPGESLKYNYTVTNLGTEDCTLGPLFLSFGEKQSYKADLSYLRYVGDLSGDTLKAGGANSYTGSFTVTADMDKAELWDPVNKHYGIQVNAWVLGTSKVDRRRWYSNIDWVTINLLSDEDTLDPNLVLTGKVLGDREWYTLGEEFEFEATLTNNTGKDLDVYITGVGRTQEGAGAITPEGESEPLPAGKSMTKTYSHTLSPEDEIKDGKFGFWLEASGSTGSGEHVSAPQKSLWVEVHSPYDLHSDALVLTRESDDPEGTRYPAGETWRYRYRATNNGDVALEDVKVKAFISKYGDWLPLGEAEAGTLAVGANGDLEGERSVGLLNAIQRYDGQDENGKARYSWGYTVDVIAEGVTPDGEIVYAKPIRDWVPIDCDDTQASAYRCLNISGEIVDPKDEYVEGDEVEVEVTVKNLSGETLTDYTILPLLGPSELDDTYDYLDSVAGDGAIQAGQAHTQTVKVTLTHKWDTDRYGLLFEADGNTGDGSPVTSNYIHFPMQILSKGKDKDAHSMPIPADLASKLRNGPVPRNLGDGEGLRSLVVVSKPTEEEYYFDGAVIPVQMRLTIDVYDEYDFMGIEPGAGDYASTEPWMSETLLPGESYGFTYLMRLDPKQSGWSTRTVSVHLKGHMSGMDEYESCEVYPLFSNPTVTAVGVSDKSASLNLEVRNGEYHDMCGAGELLDIPFNIQSGGNARIDKVKLVWEQREGKAIVNSGEIFLRDSMAPGDSFDMSRKILIVGIANVPYEPEYTLKLQLTGVFLNGKGKQEAVESTPIELPLTVLEASEAESRLTLISSVAPQKNAYGSGDTVKITLRAENHTGTTLEDVAIVPAWPCCLLKDELNEKGRFASLKDGEAAEVTLTYIVSPNDARQGRIEMLFKAAGKRQDSGKTERSLNEAITLNFNDEPQQTLSLGVIVKDPHTLYAPGSKVTVELEWRNGPLTCARFYALADNSAPSAEYANEWHSFGHGVKGYQFYEEQDVEAIKGWHRHEVTLQIPEDFEGDVYHAAWAIEGDWEDAGLHKLVRSNVDTVDLPIGIEQYEGDEALTMHLYSSTGDAPAVGIDGMVVIKAFLKYVGGHLPETYSVRYRPVGTETWSIVSKASNNSYNLNVGCPIWPHAESLSGDGWTYEFEAFDADRPELVSEPATVFISLIEFPPGDGIDGDGPGPEDDDWQVGPDGLPGDEPVPDWVDDGDEEPEEPGAPLEDVSLDVDLLTSCPNPETGDWYNGDKVHFAVTASYNGGPKVPVRIEVCVTDAVETAEPQKVLSVENSSYLVDTCEITLDASHAVNDKCVYDFVAYVYLDDEDHVDCYSETVPWIFDMAPSGMGLNPQPSPAPDGLPPREGAPVFRSLTIVDQTKDEDAYYDGATIPVKMRLTTDSYDWYRFGGISVAPGDTIEGLYWRDGLLQPGESYDFIYNMVLDPGKTGWKKRDVSITLISDSTGGREYESCEVRPPFTNPTVTLEKPDGGANIINDNDAYLYLHLGTSLLRGFPMETVDVPFSVELYSTTGTTVKNLKLYCLSDVDGKGFYKDSRQFSKSMQGNGTRSFTAHLPIRRIEGMDGDYTATFYVAGEYDDAKGKRQTVESSPISVPVEILKLEDRPGSLRLTYQVDPKKDAYFVNDELTIHLMARNNGDVALDDVSIDLTEALKAVTEEKGIALSKIDKTHLEPGETAALDCTYRVSAGDAEMEKFELSFASTALTAETRAPARSFNALVTGKVDKKIPEPSVELSAHISDKRDRYPVGTPLSCYVKVKNLAAQQVASVRVYAVGDNRFEAQYAGAPVSDLGHGAKGPLAGTNGGIKPGGDINTFVKVTIPASFGDQGTYCPAWVAEVTFKDGTTLTSNVAGLALDAMAASLMLSVTTNDAGETPIEVGTPLTVHAEMNYTGGEVPSDYIVRYRPMGKAAEWTEVHAAVSTDGMYAIAHFELPMTEADLVKDTWTYMIRAWAVTSTQVPSNVVTLEFTANAPKSAGSIDLDVEQLTQQSDPAGWRDGDKVRFRVTATYAGPETPGYMQISATPSTASVPQAYSSIENSKAVMDELEVTLDATNIVDGACLYTIEAFAKDQYGGNQLAFIQTEYFAFPMDLGDPQTAEVAENGALNLTVTQLTECKDPEGYWHDGDAVEVSVNAAYHREGTLNVLSIEAYNGKGNLLEEYCRMVNEANALSDTFEINLDADAAVDGQCLFDFRAQAFATTWNVPDYKSEPAVLVFDMAPAGKGADGPEAGSDPGKPATQINWAAIEAAKEMIGMEEKSDEAEGPEINAMEGPEAAAKEDESDGTPAKDEKPAKNEQPDENGQPDESKQPDENEQPDENGQSDEGNLPDESGPAAGSGAEDSSVEVDHCACALTGLGEGTAAYTTTLCEAHASIESCISDLWSEEDDNAAEVWEQAVSLWTDALNAEYDALAAKAGTAEAVEADRALFFAQLEDLRSAMEAYGPDDPSTVNEIVADQLKAQTALLCALNGGAPGLSNWNDAPALEGEAAPDLCLMDIEEADGIEFREEVLCASHRATEAAGLALLDEGDAEAAWAEARRLWLAELDAITEARTSDEDAGPAVAAAQASFLRWLDAREALLRSFDPALADELPAQALRTRVLDLCAWQRIPRG